jgi:predicted GNAT family N-acyltransferase
VWLVDGEGFNMMSEFIVKYVRHSQLDRDALKRIIFIKMQHWNYSTKSHQKWIKENIKADEHHLWFEKPNSQVIAYLNLVNLNIKCDSKVRPFIGIGNVCVDKSLLGEGLGLLLMQVCNYYIRQNDIQSILLCKKQLSKFYSKAGWIEFNGKVFLKGHIYNELLMFNNDLNASIIEIERNF